MADEALDFTSPEWQEKIRKRYAADNALNESILNKTKSNVSSLGDVNKQILDILNQTEVPKINLPGQTNIDKTNPFTTDVTQGDPGKFANPNIGLPNSWQELDEHSKKLIVGEKGLSLQKGILGAPYNIIDTLMKHGYSPGTEDIQGVKNSANAAGLVMGGAAVTPAETASVHAGFKAGLGSRGRYSSTLTPEMVDRLVATSNRYEGVPGANKLIVRDFRANHPEFQGSDSNLINRVNRAKRMEEFAQSTDTTIGSNFGNRGRLNTDSPGESVNWLQSQRPIDKEWVKNWAKDSGIDVTKEKTASAGGHKSKQAKTTYLDLEDPANPGNKARVRVPGPADKNRHYGFNIDPEKPGTYTKPGNYFDTGYGYPPEMQIAARREAAAQTGGPIKDTPIRGLSEHSLINQANQSYAHPEALDQALRLKFFGKAPHGDLKLVSPEYAPIKPDIKPKEFKPYTDPRQLKLLSGGYSPMDITKILLGQQNYE